MSYDLYAENPQSNDAAMQVRLLVGRDNPLPGYLRIVHGEWDRQRNQLTSNKLNPSIAANLQRLQSLGLEAPEAEVVQHLPLGSWFLQFTFTLAKPWISKDDDPFYVAESVNPLRKDKVFKVPMMSAASWKGLLRWTAMQVRLSTQTDPQKFAQERFIQTLLFGDEKGEEPGQAKDWAAYLDKLGGETARQEYEQKVRAHFHFEEKDAMPHHSGRLMFYPTFFNGIDVEVINPHSRETKAGTHPIYLECVPAGARGTFSLLYVPFDLIGQSEEDIRQQAAEDLQRVAEGLQAMFLTYGFSAKRSSGFGVAQNEIENLIIATTKAHLSQLAQEVKNAPF